MAAQSSGKAAPELPRYLHPAEVADLLQVSPKTVARWAKEGKPFLKTLGGHRRYPRRRFASWPTSCRCGRQPERSIPSVVCVRKDHQRRCNRPNDEGAGGCGIGSARLACNAVGTTSAIAAAVSERTRAGCVEGCFRWSPPWRCCCSWSERRTVGPGGLQLPTRRWPPADGVDQRTGTAGRFLTVTMAARRSRHSTYATVHNSSLPPFHQQFHCHAEVKACLSTFAQYDVG